MKELTIKMGTYAKELSKTRFAWRPIAKKYWIFTLIGKEDNEPVLVIHLPLLLGKNALSASKDLRYRIQRKKNKTLKIFFPNSTLYFKIW